MKNVILYITWVLCATLWASICFIAPDFSDNPIQDFHTAFTILAYIIALGGASFWILYLLGLNKYIAWVCLPVFGLGGAAVSYFRVAFHATITPMIVDATLHTNGGTIAGVISWQLVLWLFINMLIAIGLIIWRNHLSSPSRPWLHALVVIGLLLMYYNAHWRLKMSINQRYPYNIVHSLQEYIQQYQEISGERQVYPYQISQLSDSLDVIFILGEAARADHMQLNGYDRATNPHLCARNNIISMPHVYSEFTYTAGSVPLILSPADSAHNERSATHYSFIRVLNENGFRSAWISNQDNGHTYFSFIHETDTIVFPNANKSSFVFSPWYDEQLLPPLDGLLKFAGSKRLFVLHTIGSHWYYNLHVPPQEQIFQPLTTNRIVTNNTLEEVTNAYDNTIRYMDLIVDSIIQRFEKRPAILIYLSDHGENLGENGNFLHAGEAEALHFPACFVWYSDAYAALFPDKVAALKTNHNRRYRTDFLYHSILSAAGIESKGSSDLDIFAIDISYER